jgi:hypothetical protein
MHGNWSVAYGFTNCTFWLWRQCDKNSERAGERGFAAAAPPKQDHGSHRIWEASVSTMMSHTTIKITTMSRVTDTLADFGCHGDGHHNSQQWDISNTKVQVKKALNTCHWLPVLPWPNQCQKEANWKSFVHRVPKKTTISASGSATSQKPWMRTPARKQPPRKSFE